MPMNVVDVGSCQESRHPRVGPADRPVVLAEDIHQMLTAPALQDPMARSLSDLCAKKPDPCRRQDLARRHHARRPSTGDSVEQSRRRGMSSSWLPALQR
jgi:hypothetical protein